MTWRGVCSFVVYGNNSKLIFPMLYMLFPRISKINFSNRTSFKKRKKDACINDDIKNVGHEKVS